jgi:membrane peptidoglycan carboxypeptidase
VLEVILNIVEFGPGVYGTEAAARAFFGKPASALSSREAAQLAAVLPNPLQWSAERRGPSVRRRAETIDVASDRSGRCSPAPIERRLGTPAVRLLGAHADTLVCCASANV